MKSLPTGESSFYQVKPLVPVLLLLLATSVAATDVYVPPVPIGIASDAKIRDAKPIPLPGERASWIRVRTPLFDLISSADKRRTDRIARELETLAATLNHLRSRPGRTPAAATTVFVFSKRRESQPYFDLLLGRDNSRATGVYVRHDGGGTMFVDAAQLRFERTAMHELVHDVLRQGELAPPLWLEEGLAEYFANAVVDGSGLVAGRPIEEHAALIRRNPPRSVDDMLAVEIESAAATSPMFYAQSWAAVDWLMDVDDAAFWRFLAATESGVSVEDALRAEYAKTFDDLRAGIAAAARNTRARRIERQVPAVVTEVTAVERATLLYELGRFLSRVAGAELESARHYRAALEIDPRHAPTLAALGRYEEAVAAAPHDPEVHLAYAEALMETAIGPFAGVFEPEPEHVERFRKARTLATHALEAARVGSNDAAEGRAHGLIGSSYLVETDAAPGIAALEKARALLPQRMDFALNLYAIYLRAGQRAKADALHDAEFEHARDRQTLFAARNILLRSETNRANALARAGKLDDAAAVVRELAAATADANARRDLESQAAQLESVATVNRHIALYNDAIAFSNASRRREALKILDELLDVATDPAVVRDAKRLQADLKKRR